MDDALPFLIACAVIVVSVVLYTLYRLARNRRTNQARHPWYPLVSNSGDGLTPRPANLIVQIAYWSLALGMAIFLLLLGVEFQLIAELPAQYVLLPVAGVLLFTGLLLTALNRFISWTLQRRPN